METPYFSSFLCTPSSSTHDYPGMSSKCMPLRGKNPQIEGREVPWQQNLLPSLIFSFFKLGLHFQLNTSLQASTQSSASAQMVNIKAIRQIKRAKKTWFMFLFPNVLKRSVTQQGQFYLLVNCLCCYVGAALWANRAFDFSACWFLDMWMLANFKLWTFKLAINHGLNDILNLRASQSMLEKHFWGMTGHAIGRSLQGTHEWRVCSKRLLAAKLWSSWQQKWCQRSLGVNTAN